MYIGLYVKYLLFSSEFSETNFPNRFSKNTQISNLIKLCSVSAEMFHAGGRTAEPTQLIAVFEILRTRLKTAVI